MPPTKVLIVDDHTLVRAGLCRLLETESDIEIVGVQPTDGSAIPGIRRWPADYVPRIYQPQAVDRIIDVSRDEAEVYTRELAAKEGIFSGISSGGALCASLRLAETVTGAHIVSIVCDRGDRYLSTSLFKSFCGECPP